MQVGVLDKDQEQKGNQHKFGLAGYNLIASILFAKMSIWSWGVNRVLISSARTAGWRTVLLWTMQSLYNTLHYNMDSDITQWCCGSQIFYHGVLQRNYRKNDHFQFYKGIIGKWQFQFYKRIIGKWPFHFYKGIIGKWPFQFYKGIIGKWPFQMVIFL